MATALHQETDSADSKTAPRIFFADLPTARPVLPSQVTETHLESVTYIYRNALGCVVAPNSAGSLTLGDKVRIAMGVANAVSPNPVAGMIDKGVAVGQMTGSVSAGINAAINPVYGVLEGGYQNITGRSLHPDSPQATLTFGQRVLSGISAELNLVSTVGVGTLGAKLLSPSLPPLLFEGPTPGLQYGNGRVFQFRVEGQSPLFRVDYQPIPGSGSQSILHIDSPPLNISHLPITTPPPPPSTPVPPIF